MAVIQDYRNLCMAFRDSVKVKAETEKDYQEQQEKLLLLYCQLKPKDIKPTVISLRADSKGVRKLTNKKLGWF